MILKINALESYRNYLIIALVGSIMVNCFLFYEVFKYHTTPIVTEVVFVGQDVSGKCKTVIHQLDGRLDAEWKKDNLRKAVELIDNLKNVGYIGRTEWQLLPDTKPPEVIIDRRKNGRETWDKSKSGKNRAPQ